MSAPDRLSCEEVFARLNDFLDRELAPDEMRLVQEHLDLCEVCAREHRFERRVLDSIKDRLQRLEAPDLLLKRVAKIIEDEKKRAG